MVSKEHRASIFAASLLLPASLLLAPLLSHAAIEDQLDASRRFSASNLSFEIRPPKGYQLREADGPFTHAFAWQGPTRPDQTCASFMVSVVTPPPDGKVPTAEQMIAPVLKAIAKNRVNWHEHAAETFQLHGRTFARVYWDATEPTRKAKMRGYQYATLIGRQFVLFASQDFIPLDKTTLAVGERSIESFRIRPKQ